MYSYNKYHGVDPIIISIISKKARSLIRSRFFCEHHLEELEQELLIDVLIKIEKYQPKQCSFYGFIRAAVDSKGSNLIRTSLCQKNYHIVYMTKSEESYDFLLESIATTASFDGNNRVDLIDQMELGLDVCKVVNQLKPDLRQLCYLLQKMNISEIASFIGISPNSVYKKIRILRTIFAKHGLDFDC